MPNRSWGLVCLAFTLTACRVESDVFPAPPQRKPAVPTSLLTQLLAMSDASAEAHIVQDVVRGPAESWRWTAQNPRLRFFVVETKGLKYRVEFSVADVTFKDTGPLTINFVVNEHTIGRQRYGKPGPYVWELPVDPALLKPSSENTIGLSLENVWTSPTDGTKLGVILSAIGLVR